jgi:hypothetical protein
MVTTTVKPAKTMPLSKPIVADFSPDDVKALVMQKLTLPTNYECYVIHVFSNKYRMNIYKIFQKKDFVFESREMVHSEMIEVVQNKVGLDMIRGKERFDWEPKLNSEN